MSMLQFPPSFPLSFIVVGSGFRSLFYARIAKRFPKFFHIHYLLCRTEEKAARISAEYGIPTSVSADACIRSGPDFVVIATGWDSVYATALEWIERGFPVLLETPAGTTLDELISLWNLKEKHGARIQVAEQYHRYPIIAAGIEAVHQGKLGDPYSVFLSLAHNYHGASLIRRMLQIEPQPMRLHGERFITPVTCTDSRSGPVTDGSTTDQIRSHVNITFQSGKSACYDFADVQYRSFIRSRHVNVQGQKGEWNDCFLRYVKYAGKDNWMPRQEMLLPYLDPRYRELETKELLDSCQNWSPSLSLPQVDDEYALATMLYDMKEFLECGTEIYPLAEALEDAYTSLLFEKSFSNPGQEIISQPMPWHKNS